MTNIVVADSIKPNEAYFDVVDRTGWDEGPWNDEPDKLVWVDPATGLDCMIKRNNMGALCGYVGVPPSHPWHGRGYDECTMDCGEEWCNHSAGSKISVHGGLTYADACMEGDPATSICHVAQEGREEDVWWFGFDCAHSMDVVPGLLRYGLVGFTVNSSYKDLSYLAREISLLARQLHEAWENDNDEVIGGINFQPGQ